MPDYRLKIFLVDDEAESRGALARALLAKGYEVAEAASGLEAVARAKEEWPALIILDIVLPDIPGTEVLERLRADPLTKAIPVLLVTAKPEIVRKQMPQFTLTSDRYVEKPGRIDELLKTVQEMLGGR